MLYYYCFLAGIIVGAIALPTCLAISISFFDYLDKKDREKSANLKRPD